MSGAAKYAATAVFAVIVLVSGLLHGRQTHRWSEPPPLDQYVNRLPAVPLQFDEWTATSSRFMDDLRAHGIEDYLLLKYTNSKSTLDYQVLVVIGRPGPIASHTPDVCYRGEGFTTTKDPERKDFIIKDGPFKGRTFPMMELKLRPPATKVLDYELEVRWAWMPPGKTFMAPDNPRWEFASEPALYKVYFISKKPLAVVSQLAAGSTLPLPSTSTAPKNDINEFLALYLPRLEAALKDPEPAK